MARSGSDGPSLHRWLLVVGAVAVLAPLLAVLVVGWVASLVLGLLVGLAVSLLLTLALLAAGWRLLSDRQPLPDLAPLPASLAPMSASLAPMPASSVPSASPDLAASPLQAPAAPSPGSPPVLLVEDDPVSRRIVGRLLQRLGVQTDTVGDGQAAVEAVRMRQYALVLMDCQMPVLDGFAATAQIREWEATRSGGGVTADRLPIVALTAASPEDVQGRGRAVGMDDFLSKPLDLSRLAAVLTRWQVPHERIGQAAPSVTDPAGAPATASVPAVGVATPSSPAAAAPSSDALPVLDPAGLPLVDGRLPEPYQEIVRLFQQEAARRMEALAEAAAHADYAQVARIAHTLAGSANSIGAARLGAASAALEALAKAPATDGPALDEAVEAVRRALVELDLVLARLTAGR